MLNIFDPISAFAILDTYKEQAKNNPVLIVPNWLMIAICNTAIRTLTKERLEAIEAKEELLNNDEPEQLRVPFKEANGTAKIDNVKNLYPKRKIPHKVLGTMELSARILNPLKKMGIVTLKDLVDYTEDEIREKAKGLGELGMKKVKALVEEKYGLFFNLHKTK